MTSKNMEIETARVNGNNASDGENSRVSSVERELNGDIEAVELNGGDAQNGLMKKPLPVGDGHDGRLKRKAKRLIQR